MAFIAKDRLLSPKRRSVQIGVGDRFMVVGYSRDKKHVYLINLTYKQRYKAPIEYLNKHL